MDLGMMMVFASYGWENIGDDRVWDEEIRLARLAAEVGLPQDEVRETLAGDRYATQVRDDERTAGQLGISAVPTFVIDRALGASGAHPPEALLDLLRRGWAARIPVPIVTGGETCGIDGC